jgi:hypothetical protein
MTMQRIRLALLIAVALRLIFEFGLPVHAQAPADTVGTTVALNALNATASVTLSAGSGAGMLIASGTLAGTVVAEVSFDGGTTWGATVFFDPSTQTTASSVSLTNPNAATQRTIVIAGGASHARVRVSSFTSGSANATARSTQNSGANYTALAAGTTVAATQSGTWTAQPGNTANTTAWLVAGARTSNTAVGGAVNFGVIPAIANASAPAFTDANMVALSTDLAGNARTIDLNGNLAQGSTTSGQKGTLMQGAVTTSSASYTTAQTSPLSLDTNGSLRVNVVSGSTGNPAASNTGSAVPTQAGYTGIKVGSNLIGMTGTNVSGAIEAGDVNVAGFNGSTPLMGNGPTGAGSLRVTIASDNTANTNAWKVDGSAVTQPVSLVSVPSHAVTNAGTFAAQAAQSGTWTMQPGNTANATPWLFAGVKTHNNALPGATNLGALVGLANAAAPTYTEGNQVLLSTDLTGALRTSAPGGLAQGSITSGQTGTLIQGAVTTAAPTYTTAQTSPVSLDLHGSTRMTVMTAAGAAATLATDATAGATASTTGPQVMGFGASSAPSAVTTGQATALYLDLNGRVQENISQINGVTPLMGAGKHGHGLVARDPNPATARQHNAPLSDSPRPQRRLSMRSASAA